MWRKRFAAMAYWLSLLSMRIFQIFALIVGELGMTKVNARMRAAEETEITSGKLCVAHRRKRMLEGR